MNVTIQLERRFIVTLVLPQLALTLQGFVWGFQRSPSKS